MEINDNDYKHWVKEFEAKYGELPEELRTSQEDTKFIPLVLDELDTLKREIKDLEAEINKLRQWAQEAQNKYKQQLEITEKLRNKIRQLRTNRGQPGNWIKV